MNEKLTRINKGIMFFRKFADKSENSIYRKSVLRFCDLVEEYIKPEEENIGERIDEVFSDLKK